MKLLKVHLDNKFEFLVQATALQSLFTKSESTIFRIITIFNFVAEILVRHYMSTMHKDKTWFKYNRVNVSKDMISKMTFKFVVAIWVGKFKAFYEHNRILYSFLKIIVVAKMHDMNIKMLSMLFSKI